MGEKERLNIPSHTHSINLAAWCARKRQGDWTRTQCVIDWNLQVINKAPPTGAAVSLGSPDNPFIRNSCPATVTA